MPNYPHLSTLLCALQCHQGGCSCRRRSTGRQHLAHCPAHDDRTPSLSVCERAGRILFHCHAGCTQDAVLDALRRRGLWPEPRPGRERPRPRTAYRPASRSTR